MNNQNEIIEKSLIKDFRKSIWSKFTKGVREYSLIVEDDHIAICISGGKDSFILAKCMQELQKYGKISFKISFLCMDPGYTKEVMDSILKNAKLMNINLKVFKADIFKVADMSYGKSPCYLCARMRRGALYSESQKLGCNKIALGHHYDDVIETVLMNLLYNGTFSSMLPALPSDNYEGMSLIRPLYLVREDDIIEFKDHNNLEFIGCACSLAKRNIGGKRSDTKVLVKELKERYIDIDKNIFSATKNVNFDMLLVNKD